MAKPWVITDKAKRNIAQILDNVIEYTSHTETGTRLYSELVEKFNLIGMLPKCGKPRADQMSTREVFSRSYRIVYQEFDDHIKILTVIHSRQLYPPREKNNI